MREDVPGRECEECEEEEAMDAFEGCSAREGGAESLRSGAAAIARGRYWVKGRQRSNVLRAGTALEGVGRE